jgi:hypothetical protein
MQHEQEVGKDGSGSDVRILLSSHHMHDRHQELVSGILDLDTRQRKRAAISTDQAGTVAFRIPLSIPLITRTQSIHAMVCAENCRGTVDRP